MVGYENLFMTNIVSYWFKIIDLKLRLFVQKKITSMFLIIFIYLVFAPIEEKSGLSQLSFNNIDRMGDSTQKIATTTPL